MFSVRNVMAPVDFSEASIRALAYGVEIARRFDASLCVAHIIPVSIPAFYAYPVPSPEWQTSHTIAAENRIRSLVTQEDRDRLRCTFVARCGHIDEELIEIINEASIDFVVMGSHGRRAFQKWFLGSVTLNMLRKVPVPILTVTHSHRPAVLPFKGILAATDLSAAASHGLQIAASLARAFDSRLTVVNVLTDEPEKASAIAEVIPSKIDGVTVHKQLLAGTPHEAIVQYAEGNEFDLIVLTLQGKGFVSRALLGSTAERVVASTVLPVLSVPYFGGSPEGQPNPPSGSAD